MQFCLRGEKMKHFNNIKLLSSFREISSALEVIAMAMRIFAFVLVIIQGIAILGETKKIRMK